MIHIRCSSDFLLPALHSLRKLRGGREGGGSRSSLRPCNKGQLVPGRMLPGIASHGLDCLCLALDRRFPYQCDKTSVRTKQNDGSCPPVGCSARESETRRRILLEVPTSA